jgi:hypothetical protein
MDGWMDGFKDFLTNKFQKRKSLRRCGSGKFK